jgi:membrane protein YqaA with SNARE-associated domain
MLRRVYDRILALAAHRHAAWYLGGIAFAEASVFPVAPDAMLAAMGLARRERIWFYALICTIGSVAGGALGYLIGYAVFDRLALPVIHFYHMDHAFQTFRDRFAQYGVALILLKGLTPIPYKIVTIAAGAAKFSVWQFMAASLVTRGGRFFLVALVIRHFGTRARDFIETRLLLVTSLIAVGAVGGFVALAFL